MLQVDFKEYMLEILDQLYNGVTNAPPVFIVSHGLGCLVTLKFMLLNDRYKDLTSKIRGIAYFCPFFQWFDKGKMETAVAMFNTGLTFSKMTNSNAEQEFEDARASE